MIDELEKHRRKRLWINKETYAGIFVARLIETTGNFRAASVPGNSTPHCPHFTSRTLPFHQSAWCSGADSPILLRVHVERWDIEVTWSYLLPFCNVINCKDSLQSFNQNQNTCDVTLCVCVCVFYKGELGLSLSRSLGH